MKRRRQYAKYGEVLKTFANKVTLNQFDAIYSHSIVAGGLPDIS